MNFAHMSDERVWQIADDLMDNLMVGSTMIDHAQHTRDFTQRMRDIVTPEYLQRVCVHYQDEKGFFTQRERVALFRRPDSFALVWKQAFCKVDGEYVAEMVMVERDGRILVDHVMVF
ncbi:hypothetical protein ACRZ5S_04765 [Vibrio scophthalmi]|uniref:hypothetical protein n=1 Tax=Vibrio scophthalmi TaxID=45658 RepID=UPI003EB93376